MFLVGALSQVCRLGLTNTGTCAPRSVVHHLFRAGLSTVSVLWDPAMFFTPILASNYVKIIGLTILPSVRRVIFAAAIRMMQPSVPVHELRQAQRVMVIASLPRGWPLLPEIAMHVT